MCLNSRLGPCNQQKLGTVVPDDWQSISHHILSQCGQIGLRFLRTSSQRSGGIHLSPRSRQGFSSQGACMGCLFVFSKMHLSFDMVGITGLISRQLGRMRTTSKASSMNISTLMPNSLAKHSMSPLKVQMTALKRDVGGPFHMKHCSE